MSETNERGDARQRTDDSVRADGGTADGPTNRGQNRRQDRRGDGTRGREDRGPGDQFARASIRWLLALIGVVVVLFGLGQAVGVSLLGMVADALASQTGRWLVVAFLGLLVILAAAKLDWR